MARVKGKAVLVTGGALGIGRATSSLLAQEGASVAVADVLDELGIALVKEIRRRGGTARFWHLDVADESNVRVVAAEVGEAFGRIDVLVNNAGSSPTRKPSHENLGEEWDRVMASTVKGAFLCTRTVVPWMRRNGGGSIVHLSVIPERDRALEAAPYRASEGALRRMAQDDARLYARDRIRVNSVHPAVLQSPMVESLLRASSDVAEGRKVPEDGNSKAHVSEPEDVAYAVLYLASDESKFVTGSELVIEAGESAA